MGPIQRMDARLFLLLNGVPHTPLTNKAFYGLSTLMNAGGGWVLFLLGAALFDGRRGHRALHGVLLPLWLATMAVEFPIKRYFRRRRPFLDVVQAVAVGRKPIGYSFPSGHSAAAFAGAWLLRQYYPKLWPLWYTIAALVGFSRIYLGVHYPGDVMSGALTGTAIAELARWSIAQSNKQMISADEAITM
ncbi:MAG: phosphatase PAP2 family protein [Oscillochloris sp.]|nr:phosphatase PAP2 family protein [Oscillochloris sp.]